MAPPRGILPGLEIAQRGLPGAQQQPSHLEFQYPVFQQQIRELRDAGLPEELIAKFLANAEISLKQKYGSKLTEQEITKDVIGREPDFLQKTMAVATRAAGLGFTQGPIGRETAEQAGGLPWLAGTALGTAPLASGVTRLAGLIPGLAARPIISGAAAGTAFGVLEPALRGEAPTTGGVLGSAALFGALGPLGRRRPLPGTKPRPAEPAVPPGVGPFEPGGEAPLIGREGQPPFAPGTAKPPTFEEPPFFIGGGEAPVAGMERAAGGSAVADVVSRAPTWVRDTFQSVERPISQLLKAERQPAEALLKDHFATRPRPGYEEELTLNMGFNPFALFGPAKEPIGKVLRGLLGGGGDDVARAMETQIKNRVLSRWRTRLDIFRGTSFLETIEPARENARDIVVRFGNTLDDIVRPLSKEQRNGPLIEALNSEDGYNAAAPAVRATADRIRAEVLNPLFELLKTTTGVRGREELRFLPYYFRHILDRRETMRFLERSIAEFEKRGAGQDAAEMRTLLRGFATRGNADYFADEDFARLVGANMRDFFKDVPPAEAGFGAMERRLANLPTFIRDFDMVMSSYIRGTARKVSYDPILRDLSHDMVQLDTDLRQRGVQLMRELLGMRHPSAEKIDGYMRSAGLSLHKLFGVHPLAVAERVRAEDLSRWATQAEYYRTLYGNGGGAIINMLQTFTNTFPALAQRYGSKEGASLMMQAFRLGFTEEGRVLMRRIVGTKAMPGAGTERPALEGLANWGDLFGLVETNFNQRVAGLAEYLAQTGKGVADNAAVKAARQFVDKTQFFQDPLRRPEVLSGPVGRFLGQFQSFKLNQLDFFLNELDPVGKAWFIGMYAALGGASAIPFAGPKLKEYFQPQLGFDPASGVPGLAGLDVARRLNPLEPLTRALTGRPEEFPTRAMQSMVGPGAGLALGLYEAAWRFVNTVKHAGAPTAAWYAASSALRELEPTVVTRAAQAAEVAATGELRAGRPSGLARGLRAAFGTPPVRFGGATQALQAAPGSIIEGPLGVGLGVPTQRQLELERMVQETQQKQEAARAQRTAIATAYLHYKSTGDAAAMREAIRAAPGVNVRQIILDLERPAESRLRRRTPVRFRQESQ